MTHTRTPKKKYFVSSIKLPDGKIEYGIFSSRTEKMFGEKYPVIKLERIEKHKEQAENFANLWAEVDRILG